MNMHIRKAQPGDITSVKRIYENARKFMADHGNPDQWGTAYPPEEMVRRDIGEGKLFVIADRSEIHGVFFFSMGPDETYGVIRDGAWHRDAPYGVIHRIAGDGSGGILQSAVEYACSQADYLRIDTHEDNYVMQRALAKLGFRRCGMILAEDGTPRIAYDR